MINKDINESGKSENEFHINIFTLTFFFEIIECHLKIALIKENSRISSNLWIIIVKNIEE